jgi:hypothetical protein
MLLPPSLYLYLSISIYLYMLICLYVYMSICNCLSLLPLHHTAKSQDGTSIRNNIISIMRLALGVSMDLRQKPGGEAAQRSPPSRSNPLRLSLTNLVFDTKLLQRKMSKHMINNLLQVLLNPPFLCHTYLLNPMLLCYYVIMLLCYTFSITCDTYLLNPPFLY